MIICTIYAYQFFIKILLYALPRTYKVKLRIFVANDFLVFHENAYPLWSLPGRLVVAASQLVTWSPRHSQKSYDDLTGG